jgi:hypothetical protein
MRGALTIGAGTCEHDVVRRDQVGKLLDQPRKLLDLTGQRRGCRQRLVEDRFNLALRRAKPPVEFRKLTREIG